MHRPPLKGSNVVPSGGFDFDSDAEDLDTASEGDSQWLEDSDELSGSSDISYPSQHERSGKPPAKAPLTLTYKPRNASSIASASPPRSSRSFTGASPPRMKRSVSFSEDVEEYPVTPAQVRIQREAAQRTSKTTVPAVSLKYVPRNQRQKISLPSPKSIPATLKETMERARAVSVAAKVSNRQQDDRNLPVSKPTSTVDEDALEKPIPSRAALDAGRRPASPPADSSDSEDEDASDEQKPLWERIQLVGLSDMNSAPAPTEKKEPVLPPSDTSQSRQELPVPTTTPTVPEEGASHQPLKEPRSDSGDTQHSPQAPLMLDSLSSFSQYGAVQPLPPISRTQYPAAGTGSGTLGNGDVDESVSDSIGSIVASSIEADVVEDISDDIHEDLVDDVVPEDIEDEVPDDIEDEVASVESIADETADRHPPQPVPVQGAASAGTIATRGSVVGGVTPSSARSDDRPASTAQPTHIVAANLLSDDPTRRREDMQREHASPQSPTSRTAEPAAAASYENVLRTAQDMLVRDVVYSSLLRDYMKQESTVSSQLQALRSRLGEAEGSACHASFKYIDSYVADQIMTLRDNWNSKKAAYLAAKATKKDHKYVSVESVRKYLKKRRKRHTMTMDEALRIVENEGM